MQSKNKLLSQAILAQAAAPQVFIHRQTVYLLWVFIAELSVISKSVPSTKVNFIDFHVAANFEK